MDQFNQKLKVQAQIHSKKVATEMLLRTEWSAKCRWGGLVLNDRTINSASFWLLGLIKACRGLRLIAEIQNIFALSAHSQIRQPELEGLIIRFPVKTAVLPDLFYFKHHHHRERLTVALWSSDYLFLNYSFPTKADKYAKCISDPVLIHLLSVSNLC